MDRKTLKDINHSECREFMKGKKCEFCEKLFDDIINKTGLYDFIKNPPELIDEDDVEEFGLKKSIELARDGFVRDAEGFARCKVLCRKHHMIIREDNNERNDKGIDIPTDFSLLRYKKSLI